VLSLALSFSCWLCARSIALRSTNVPNKCVNGNLQTHQYCYRDDSKFSRASYMAIVQPLTAGGCRPVTIDAAHAFSEALIGWRCVCDLQWMPMC
jgi:hypothetical protein